jgi:uncharacterized protein with gpF-like domain
MGGMAANMRAQRIASTEGGACLNAGHQVQADVMEAEGFIVTKTWSAVGDDDTRDSHMDMDGQQVRAQEMFNLAG